MDSFEDGWNGNKINFYSESNPTQSVIEKTLSIGGTVTYDITLTPGKKYKIIVGGGDYVGETSWEIKKGEVVVKASTGGEEVEWTPS